MTAASMSSGRAWPRKVDGRTRQRVLKNSWREAGSERARRISSDDRYWLGVAFKDAQARSWAAGKRKGGRLDGGGGYARDDARVHQLMLGYAVSTGLVFPSYRAMAASLKMTVRMVVEAVRRLVAGGWLKLERRFVWTDREGERGPQVEQASNLYEVLTPLWAQKQIARWRRARGAPMEAAAEAAGIEPKPTEADVAREERAEKLDARIARAVSAGRRRAETFAPTSSLRAPGNLSPKELAAWLRAAADAAPPTEERDFPEGSESGA